MRIRSFAAITALTVASAPLLVAPAQAADTTLGEAFDDEVSCNTSGTEIDGYTYIQTGPSNYAAPTAGVITSWTAQNMLTFSAALRVARFDTETGYFPIVAKAPVAEVSRGARIPVRVPVQAGDVIGLYYPRQNNSFTCFRGGKDGSYRSAYGSNDANVTYGGSSGSQLNVSAILEPDADGDGFGDTTQDNCSTDATTQGACPDFAAPQTTITKVKAAKIKAGASNKAKARVTVAFKANERSTFRCSVDGARYKACSSPFGVRLVRGEHTIAVQATDVVGNVDKTPATAKVTVKRAKK